MHFEATLSPVANATQALVWDEITAAALTTRGDVRDYSFTCDAAGWVELQDIATTSGSATLQILSPNGTVLKSGTYNSTKQTLARLAYGRPIHRACK